MDAWVSPPKKFDGQMFFYFKGNKTHCYKVIIDFLRKNKMKHPTHHTPTIKICTMGTFKNKNGNDCVRIKMASKETILRRKEYVKRKCFF